MNVSTEKTTHHGGAESNGHNGNGRDSDPALLRFYQIEAELEQLPSVMPESIAGQPRWLRNLTQKARELILMVEKKTASAGTFTVREGIVYVFVAASLTFAATSYWKGQSRDETLIRMETEIQHLKADLASTKAELTSKVDQAANWGQSAKGDVKYMQGRLDQIAEDKGKDKEK